MVELLDVIDKRESISFLQDETTNTFIVILTTYITKKMPIIWKGLDWESFLNMLLKLKVIFKIVVYLCASESFKFFLSIVMKSIYVTKFRFKIGQYMAAGAKVLSFLTMIEHVLFYVYLFIWRIGKSV
jgi:hypothetical protein